MPHITEHAPNVSTRSVNPYARESLRKRLQQDIHRHTHRWVVQNHFSRRFEGCTSQIRSYLKLDFLHDASTSNDMEIKLPPLLGMKVNQGKSAILLLCQWKYWHRAKNRLRDKTGFVTYNPQNVEKSGFGQSVFVSVRRSLFPRALAGVRFNRSS